MSIGIGKHIDQVHTPVRQLGLVLFVVNFVYNTGLTLIKVSVLLFYVRVFRTVRAYQIIFWIVGVILVGCGIVIDLLALLTCNPTQKSWNSTVSDHCLSRSSNFFRSAVPNVVTDLILLILPMPILWHLQIKISRKIGLVAVFATGYW